MTVNEARNKAILECEFQLKVMETWYREGKNKEAIHYLSGFEHSIELLNDIGVFTKADYQLFYKRAQILYLNSAGIDSDTADEWINDFFLPDVDYEMGL